MLYERDLKELVDLANEDLHSLKNSSIFITGGTGYIGRWLLEALTFYNSNYGSNIKICVLTRNPRQFVDKLPHLALHSSVRLVTGDIRTFEYPVGQFDYVIHAATDVVEQGTPLEIFDVTVHGTERLINFCQQAGVNSSLLLSSGAVYGPIPQSIHKVREDYDGRPALDNLYSAYGLGKMVTEWLGAAHTKKNEIEFKSARVFAQVGPYLVLNKQFAAGNFLRDALLRKKFLIKGNGTPKRSYMYGVDLVVWLLAILVRGKGGRAYNVGSDVGISIKDLAILISEISGAQSCEIEVLGMPDPQGFYERYVPDVSRASEELNLKINIPLHEAFLRTFDWYKNNREWIDRS